MDRQIKAIETYYNGYKFRSRLEARWAVFFDYVGIRYEYEPEGINEDGVYYLPDFYLPDFHVYFEVKRADLSNEEREESEKKIKYGADTGTFAGLICYGDPMDDNLFLFCHEFNDSGGGPASFRVSFSADADGYQVLARLDDKRDRTTYASYDCEVPTERIDHAFLPEVIYEGKKYARQVRFEHGQTPNACTVRRSYKKT